MSPEEIKKLFLDAVSSVTSDISRYTIHPEKDFTRTRKLPPDKLISFLVSCGSSSTKIELLDFFEMDTNTISSSAFSQQRAKLSHKALEAVFQQYNHSLQNYDETSSYRYFAVDGSTFSFFSKPSLASEEYYISEGHSEKGFFSVHLNAFYDLQKHTYSDALIQSAHYKDEYAAFSEMVDRHQTPSGMKDVFIGDRGYCSYNNMAHVLEKNQFFLFRTKDIHSKGLVGNFNLPAEESFDIRVNVTLVRSHKKSIHIEEKYYRRHVDANTAFDYITPGSSDTYSLSFRIVRFPISEDTYECILTNLPEDEFPPEELKKIYFSRWGIEGSFRKLKYTIGLSNFHACKPEYIKQEIWAKLIAYNITETLINHTVVKHGTTKHNYKVNFSIAAHICRVFLRITTEKDSIDVLNLLCKQLIPIRDERQYPRLKTAHFRRPRYFIYRAA